MERRASSKSVSILEITLSIVLSPPPAAAAAPSS